MDTKLSGAKVAVLGDWQLIVDQSQFDNLRPDWEKLFIENPQHSPFLAWGWVRAWLKHRANPYHLRILVLRDADDDVQFILPLVLRPRASVFGMERLAIVCSHGSEASDYLGCLRLPELNNVVAELAANGLKHFFGDQYRLELAFADNNDAFPANLEEIARAEGRATRLYTDAVCPAMDLPDSWDEFLLGLSANFRSQVRRHYKRIIAAENLSFHSVAPSDADSFIRTLVLLNRDRIKQKGQTSSLENDHTREFIVESLVYMAEQGLAWMDTIEEGTDVVGCSLHFVHGRTVYYYMGGFDERATNLRPGTALFALVIQRSIALKYTSFDFLRGNDPYKYRWGATDRKTSRLEIYPRSLFIGKLRWAIDGVDLKLRARIRELWRVRRSPSEFIKVLRQ